MARQRHVAEIERIDPAALEAATVASVRGVVLELGPGTGANFDDLPADITWLGLEPDEDALPRLRVNARHFSRSARVIEGVAEHIPLDDDSVDTVLSTLVLCSVEDTPLVLSEIARVLRPGGRFVFFEHIAAPPKTLRRLGQRTMRGLTRRRPGDCDPARDTLDAIRTGFERVDVTEYSVRGFLGVRVPHIAGSASSALSRGHPDLGAASTP